MSLAVDSRARSFEGIMGFEGRGETSSEKKITGVATLPPPKASDGGGRASGGGAIDEGGGGQENDGGGGAERPKGQISKSSLGVAKDDEEEEEVEKASEKLDLGPQLSLKQQLEKDKEDESLRRWKEQLLGTLDLVSLGENLEPEVKILSLCIVSPDRPDIVLEIPNAPRAKGAPWFTLKEGSRYRLKFSFAVGGNIVSGLRYTNRVWKAGVKVDSTREMLGTFSPQPGAYVHELPEERTPSGIFARGSYSARSRFVDDDGKCHLEINYTFEIRKEWLPSK